MIRRAVKDRVTWNSSERQLPACVWREQKDTLAVHLSDPAWRWVSAA